MRKYFIPQYLFILILLFSKCFAQVTFDNTQAPVGGTTITSLTLNNFAVGAGSNRFLFCGVSQYANPDTTVSSITFNTSETFTIFDTVSILESPGTRRVTIAYLKAPSNTTANIVVSWGGSTVDEAVFGCTSWSGVNQTTPLGTAVKNSGTSTSSSINVSSVTGNVVHDAISADASNAPGLVANQTLRWRGIAAANTTEGAGQSAAGAATVTMTWSGIAVPSNFAHIGVDIKQVSGTGPICGSGVIGGGILGCR